MKSNVWRILAIVLILANLGLLFTYLFSPNTVDSNRPELPPLDPSLPWLDLVAEVTQADGPRDGDLCNTIGPLPTMLSLQRAEDRLRPFASSIRTRQTTADSDRGWWVFLPTGSRTEAMSLTRELAERGIEDFFVVTSGPYENTVSVGLYENIDNARARQSRIRAQGFNAQMEVRRESVPQFWVDYRVGPDDRSPWRFIVRASPGSQHREIPCWDE